MQGKRIGLSAETNIPGAIEIDGCETGWRAMQVDGKEFIQRGLFFPGDFDR
jgi:hypothetical protein